MSSSTWAVMDDLKRQILEFLASDPGASTSAVRSGVSGKARRIRSALGELEAAGKIRNEGTDYRHAWHLMERIAPAIGELPENLSGSFPKCVAGVEVAYWATPDETADALGTTPRTLSRWEGKGLPVGRESREVRYPFPHCLIWATWFGIEKKRGGTGTTKLSMELAIARERVDRIERWGSCEGLGPVDTEDAA